MNLTPVMIFFFVNLMGGLRVCVVMRFQIEQKLLKPLEKEKSIFWLLFYLYRTRFTVKTPSYGSTYCQNGSISHYMKLMFLHCNFQYISKIHYFRIILSSFC